MTFTDKLAQAFKDLLAQGSYGYGPICDGAVSSCQYLTPQGNSCIVGLFLKAAGTPPEALKGLLGTALSPSVRSALLERFPDLANRAAAPSLLGAPALSAEGRALLDLLSEAQIVHDKTARRDTRPPSKEALLRTAQTYRAPNVLAILESLT